MSMLRHNDQTPDDINPLDAVEQLAISNDWPHQRQGEDELAAEIDGGWCQYRLWFVWHGEINVLQLSCALDMKVPRNKVGEIYHLLGVANEKIWLGHFDLWSEENLILFRYALLARNGGVAIDLVEDIIDIATAECERFYPAFQFVIWGGKSAEDALQAALLETEGEA